MFFDKVLQFSLQRSYTSFVRVLSNRINVVSLLSVPFSVKRPDRRPLRSGDTVCVCASALWPSSAAPGCCRFPGTSSGDDLVICA